MKGGEEMSAHLDWATVLTEKIATKAEATLDDLEREMRLMQWPPEIRKIMWDAVAQVAAAYAEAAYAEQVGARMKGERK
jgi:hypothetical protein